MDVRGGWIVVGLAAVAGLAWYFAQEPAAPAPSAETQALAAQEADAAVLYRWRDANGVLQITDTPPEGRKYERVERDAPPAIEVRGDRP